MSTNDPSSNGAAAAKKKRASPAKLAHVVLTFLRYDDEHHRVAVIHVPGLAPRVPNTAGVHHVAFTYETLDNLAAKYLECKELGLKPVWSVNHGPTTSIYYQDPDGNLLETQVDNFDTVEEANEFMEGPLFDENAIGTDFDPDELVEKLRLGVDHGEIKKRVEIGPRTTMDY